MKLMVYSLKTIKILISYDFLKISLWLKSKQEKKNVFGWLELKGNLILHVLCGPPLVQAKIIPDEKKKSSLSFTWHALAPCICTSSLHGHVALAAAWHMAMGTPHTGTERELEYPSLNGLQLETHTKLARCWTWLYFNVKHKLRTLAFVLALLKTRLDLFHG